MKKVLALVLSLVLVVGVVAVFAACGGDKEPTGDEAKKTVIVGYTIYEPMNYKDENGKLVGFDTELAEKVFGNLGYKVVFQEIDWNNKYTDLNTNTIDCVWNGFTANTADDDGVLRSEKVDFSYNYMENRQVVVVKADAGIEKAEDLNGKLGIAESGSAGETYAKAFEGTTFKGFTKQTDCLVDIKAGTADFAVVDAQLAKSYVGKGDYADLKIVDGLSSDVEYYAIGFKKGSELTANVNAQLDALAKDGTIAALAEKYGVQNTAITDFSDQK
ncbi:MAG: transporter substrate-binding domain-containing protein [Ruminococcaceae bacterium]|nr:transporter substrate-binding domain-containing protein [Oscillospiraceae bacterium]